MVPYHTHHSLMVTFVEVSPSSFRSAFEKYMDENKPDRMMRQQMESWKLEWQPLEASSLSFADSPFEPTHVVAGDLLWEGEYMRLKISVRCCWKGTRKDGSIRFVCDVADGAFTDFPAPVEQSMTQKEAKVVKRLRQKMIRRLEKDDYIGKLVKERQSLIEAAVSIKKEGDLEERVYCDETTAEGIRRSVFSRGESSLDVFDWILSLPFLPSCSHEGSVDVVTPLADRVKLRCLEEATYDACEQQEDDDIVEDLHISKKKRIV